MPRKKTTAKQAPPMRPRGTRLCIAITKDGVQVYGNRAALQAIAARMSWIANSTPADHYEMHLVWHLLSFAKTRNVSVLVDEAASRVFGRGSTKLLKTFELSFMIVEESDLRKLRKYQSAGVLPPDWVDAD